MIDLKHEIERELSRLDPPDLWDRIQAAAAADAGTPVADLTVDGDPRRPARWLAVAAVIALLALTVTLARRDGDDTVDTTPVTEPTTTSAPPVWTGPVLDRGMGEHPMTEASRELAFADFVLGDPLDAGAPSVDVVRLRFSEPDGTNNGRWHFDLAAAPPPLADLEPGIVVTYGVAFDTDDDGIADYTTGIDNDAPVRGDFRAWVTDVATGQTSEQIGPPYGFPVEFGYGTDSTAPDAEEVFLMFLGDDGRSAPPGLDPRTARFFVWTSVTRDGVLVANDYVPDTGWMSGR